MGKNYRAVNVYFPTYGQQYNWLPVDTFELIDILPDYRVSSNIIYYDGSNKLFKSVLPKFNWTMFRLEQPPRPSLSIYWIIHDRYDFLLYHNANAHNGYKYMEIMKKLGNLKKSIYRLGVWYMHLLELSREYLFYGIETRFERCAVESFNKDYGAQIVSILDELYQDCWKKEYI